jgi:rhamnogalacturonan endolyase
MIQNICYFVCCRLHGAEYSVIYNSNDKLEISFRSTYDPSNKGTKLPLSIDIRYFYPSKHSFLSFKINFLELGLILI